MHKIVNTIYAVTAGAAFGLLAVIGVVIGGLGMFYTLLKKLGLLALALAILSSALRAQSVSGGETTITYSGTNAQITNPNTPGTSFNSPNGLNTFILPIPNPSVSIRFYVTNNTANACASGFTAQLWAASDAQTSSFNNQLTNWQVIPLQDASGNLLTALLPSIPASGAIYFSSTAISSPRVALQFINTVAASCATTNIEITAVITNVAVTSPLLSANNPTNFNGATGGQVQGVVAQSQNGATVNTLITGGLQLPLNGTLLTPGIDNWNSNFKGLGTGNSGLFVINTVPTPAGANELAIAIDADTSDNVNSNITAPWTCVAGNSCQNASGLSTAFTKNPKSGTAYNRVYTNVTTTGQELNAIVLFSSPTATVRQAIITASPTTGTATLLNGSALIVAVECSLTSCTVPPPTDTQGNVFQLLTVQNFANGLRASSLWVWAGQNLTTVGSDTVTWAASAGTINLTDVIEVTGIAPAGLTTLTVSQQMDPTGAQVVRQDAQAPNQFVASITISTNTTTQIQAAPTTIGAGGVSVPVRAYVTDFQINTTTAGTATTLQLKAGTGSNCGTGTVNLSGILYPDTTVGIQSVLGTRTPLIPPLQSAICVTQAGTTPGTATVEIRGFFAP